MVIGNRVIELNMRMIWRRREVLGFSALLDRLYSERDFLWIAAPKSNPIPAALDNKSKFLAGGDILLNGSEIYVGCSGNASNRPGIEWLRRTLWNLKTRCTVDQADAEDVASGLRDVPGRTRARVARPRGLCRSATGVAAGGGLDRGCPRGSGAGGLQRVRPGRRTAAGDRLPADPHQEGASRPTAFRSL